MADEAVVTSVVDVLVADEQLVLDFWTPIWIAAERAGEQVSEEVGIAILQRLSEYVPSNKVFRSPPVG